MTEHEARGELACGACGSLGLCDCPRAVSADERGCEHCGERGACACASCGTCVDLQRCDDCRGIVTARLVRYLLSWDRDRGRDADREAHLEEVADDVVRRLVGDVLRCQPSKQEPRAIEIDLERRRVAVRWYLRRVA